MSLLQQIMARRQAMAPQGVMRAQPMVQPQPSMMLPPGVMRGQPAPMPSAAPAPLPSIAPTPARPMGGALGGVSPYIQMLLRNRMAR